MPNYGVYTTLHDIHTLRDSSESTDTGMDALFSDLIQSTSREMEDLCAGRKFYPILETRHFDKPFDWMLEFGDHDLLEVVTLSNGEGTAIASTAYNLFPYDNTPYFQLEIKYNSGVVWLPDSAGNYRKVILLNGVWGYHRDYASAWLDTTAVLAAAITTTTATTFTCTTGLLHAGYLIKIDSEYMYVSAVATGASDTVTVVRGVNGSTAAIHLISTAIARWQQPALEMICRNAVQAYQRTRDNPTGETVNIGGDKFVTPKDVKKWLEFQLAEGGYRRGF